MRAQTAEQQRIDVARRELKEETTKANESLVAENKALRGQLAAVLDELRRIEAGNSVNDELLDVIEMIAAIMDGMKEQNAYGE